MMAVTVFNILSAFVFFVCVFLLLLEKEQIDCLLNRTIIKSAPDYESAIVSSY